MSWVADDLSWLGIPTRTSKMNGNREQASTRFNQAAEWNDDVWNIQFRVKVAVMRLDARFEKCQHDLTWTRYRHLMDKHTSTLKWYDYLEPVDVSERTWKAARQWVKFDHLRRCNKIRKVGERMMGKDRGIER
jgi:hypothetical protein